MALNGLPKVKFDYGNGALGQTISSADGLLCIAVCGAVAVGETFSLAKHYSIRKLADLEVLGVTPKDNALLHQTVKHFYTEAPSGTQVYVIGYPSTLKMSDVLNKDNPYLRNVIESTNGQLRGLIVTKVAEKTPTVTKGLNDDVTAAMLNAQSLGEWSKDTRYAPIFTILDGLNFNGNAQDLQDLKTYQYNRVGVVIGSTEKGSANQAVGLIAGRIASTSVDTNIGRVKDGALKVLTMYASDTPIELADTESIYNFSYLTFRTFTGISGYFIADDLLATKETDDYNHLTALRTIDKAFRIAYAVLITQLLDKVQVKADGTMLRPVIVSWQQIVENAIKSNMAGELSDVNDDGGVQCYIDPTQDVLATSTINIELRVRPYAYARYINVLLGFTINE